jgi:hypothetical protein
MLDITSTTQLRSLLRLLQMVAGARLAGPRTSADIHSTSPTI